MQEPIDLRNAREEDLPFFFSLYSDVRGPEMSGWGWPAAQRESFLRMQFEAQRRSWQAAYPNTADRVVCLGDLPIGRILTAHTQHGTHLIDIALLGEFRSRGIGAWLLRQLMTDCERSHSALSLQVLNGNPARRLYLRLGFRDTDAGEMYIHMRWTPEFSRDTETSAGE